jgi:hypothetical protein
VTLAYSDISRDHNVLVGTLIKLQGHVHHACACTTKQFLLVRISFIHISFDHESSYGHA